MTTSSINSAAVSITITNRKTQARRGLFIFFAIVIPFSLLFQWLMVTRDYNWVMAVMWVPALASVIARFALGEGFGDVSFAMNSNRVGRALLYGWLFPVVVGLVAYGAAWLIGLAEFVPPAEAFGIHLTPVIAFLASLLPALTLVTYNSVMTAAGEEIGWRGYMLTRLIDAGAPKPILLSGLIWGLWHLPMILVGIYAVGAGSSPLLSILLFVVGITGMSYLLAWLRLDSGSVWPAVLFHGAWNAVIQGPFDHATSGAAAGVWTGEAGILTTVVLVVASFILTRRPWVMRRQPNDPRPQELN